MALSNDLVRLIGNMNENQLDVLSGIVARLAVVSSERFTGQITFAVNVNQGTVGDMHINRGEVVRVKRRRVSCSGIE